MEKLFVKNLNGTYWFLWKLCKMKWKFKTNLVSFYWLLIKHFKTCDRVYSEKILSKAKAHWCWINSCWLTKGSQALVSAFCPENSISHTGLLFSLGPGMRRHVTRCLYLHVMELELRLRKLRDLPKIT